MLYWSIFTKTNSIYLVAKFSVLIWTLTTTVTFARARYAMCSHHTRLKCSPIDQYMPLSPQALLFR